MKSIAQDVIGELLETGQQAAQQLTQVPGQVVKGALPGAKPSAAGTPRRGDAGRPAMPDMPDLEALTQGGAAGQSVQAHNDAVLQQMVQTDNQNRQMGIDRARQQLAALKIKRYREIQQEIEKVRKKKEEEIPAYIAGTPGGPRTWQEKLEQDEKKKKEAQKAQEQDSGAVLPKGPKPRGSLFFAEEHKGSSELKKSVQG